MSEGRLRCSGSSLFLKTRYGAGYLLSMAKMDSSCSALEVEKVVQGLIPEASIISHVAGEIILRLPLHSVPLFAPLFETLQTQAASLGVGSYGVSITTLEQVDMDSAFFFLKVSSPLQLHLHLKLT